MKFVLAFCLIALALGAPQSSPQVLRDERTNDGKGNFKYALSVDNGIEVEVTGARGNMQGYYDLPLPDGGFARITFVADQNGFRPSGDILPK